MRGVWIGCSGWNYKHWKGVVYPEGMPERDWLRHYATLWRTVEINTTFYHLPRESSVERWVEEVPDGFLFAVKGSRYLTHQKRLLDPTGGIRRFYERIKPMSDSPKMGPVLWQLPESFERDDERLENFMKQLPSGRHAWEFRHPSWFAEEIYEMLRTHNAALVIADHKDRPWQPQELTADWTYLRFHYGKGEEGDYSDRALGEWRKRIEGWRKQVEVYGYFNHDWVLGQSDRQLQRYVDWTNSFR